MQQGDRYTHRFTVSPAIYTGFIQAYNDKNPLHTDADFAISKGFAGRVMHGNILNGFLSYFVGECLPLKNVIIHAQSIKYALPVYLDDELELNAEITGFFESVNTYEFRFYFKNKEGKKVAKGDIQIGLLI
jgi:3-hydroxybutyryl-CoA dehydratase